MVKSIRWTLQLWHAGLLAVVLAGFGVASYLGVSRLRFDAVDADLSQSVQIVAAGFRMRPPPGRGDNMAGPPGDFRGRGRQDGFGPRQPPDDGRGGQGQFGRGGGPGGGPRGNGGPPQLDLPPELTVRLENAGPQSLYLLIWGPQGQLIRSMPPGNSSVPDPGAGDVQFFRQRSPELPTIRSRGDVREAYVYGPAGIRILVGKSVRPEREDLRRLAILLAAAGTGVLVLGLAGGWIVTVRAVRPIRAITTAAQEISASNLSRRIDVAGTQSELGTLASVLNDTFERLETAFQQQVRFTADASHELRTPLSVIHTHAQLALSRERTAAEYQKMFQTCLRASERMKNLVDSLLLLARADAGRLSLNLAEIDLREIVQDAIDMLAPLAATRNVAIESTLQPAVVSADASRVAQVAVNLISNAIRYNHEGGHVRISLSQEEDQAVLSIADTGVGISVENQKFLFERFYRVDVARSREDGGSGLGLSICKSIIDGHAGTISFQSEIAVGTTFTVRLRAKKTADIA